MICKQGIKWLKLFLFFIPVTVYANFSDQSVIYISPAGEKILMPTLFDAVPNPQQSEEEYLTDKDWGVVYAARAGLDMRFAEDSQAYVLLHSKPLQRIIFEQERYKLVASDITMEQFNELPKFDKYKIDSVTVAYMDERKQLPNTPNLLKAFKEYSTDHCGRVKLMLRNDANGDAMKKELWFDHHGKIVLPIYWVNKITCTEQGRIILQLGIFRATGGKHDYFVNEKGEYEEAWEYQPVIAIVDTGITIKESQSRGQSEAR